VIVDLIGVAWLMRRPLRYEVDAGDQFDAIAVPPLLEVHKVRR
jgi:hypothetical protein